MRTIRGVFATGYRRHIVMLLSLLVGTLLVGAAPASADHGDRTCYTQPPVDARSICDFGGAVRSAATGKYVTVQSDGRLTANGTHHGWYQHVEFVYLPEWDNDPTSWNWWALTLSATARLASASGSGGVIRADSTFIGWFQAFEIIYLGTDGAGDYYGIKHLASGKWLTAYDDGRLRADHTFTGWNQAFRIG